MDDVLVESQAMILSQNKIFVETLMLWGHLVAQSRQKASL